MGQGNSVKNGRLAASNQSCLHAKSMPGQKLQPDKGMLGVKTALKSKGVAVTKRGRKARPAAPERVVDKAAQRAHQSGAQQIASKETSLCAEDIPEAKAPADELVTQTGKIPAKQLHGNKARHRARKRTAAETPGRERVSYSQQAPPAAAAKVPGKGSPPQTKQALAAQALGKKRVSQTQQGPENRTPGRQAKRSAAEPALADLDAPPAGQVAAEDHPEQAQKWAKQSAVRACKADQQSTPSGQLSGPAVPQSMESKQAAAGLAQKACEAAHASPDGMLRGRKRKKPAADLGLPDQKVCQAKQAPAAQLPHNKHVKEPASKQSKAKHEARTCNSWHPCLSVCLTSCHQAVRRLAIWRRHG